MSAIGTHVVGVSGRTPTNPGHVQDKGSVASSSGNPSVDTFIEREAALGYAVSHLDDVMVVTYLVSDINAQ